MQKGFTLIELLITISVVSVGITGALIAVQQSISAIDYSNARFTAALLAQEGVEIVKNIRDTNLLEGPSVLWNQGINPGIGSSKDYELQYTNAQYLSPETQDPSWKELSCGSNPCDYSALTFLKRDSNGFYNYTMGESTKFKRTVHITAISSDKMELKVVVYWRRRGGGHHELILRQDVYDWW